jgi:hypothetical protein
MEALAEKFKDVPNLKFMKIDAVENEIDSIEVRMYPKIKMYSSEDKSKPDDIEFHYDHDTDYYIFEIYDRSEAYRKHQESLEEL